MMKTRVLVLLAAGITLITPIHLSAQTPPTQEVLKILGISVEGNTLADPAAIIANSGLKVGGEITVPGDQVSQAIRKLWSLRLFEDIQILTDRKMGTGVFLLIKVTEYARFDRVEIEGNDGVSTDDIRKVIPLIRGQVLPPPELKKMSREISKLYEKEGYLLATVTIGTEPIDSARQRMLIRVTINEGKEVQVASIEFDGNTAFTDDDLSGAMDETSVKRWWKFWSSAKLDRKKYEEDKVKIVQFYRRNGYRDAQLVSDTLAYSEDRTEMFIKMKVHEGLQYKIRQITWQGNTVYTGQVLNERINMLPGEVYNAEKFEKNLRGNEDQTDVAALYLDNGYLRFNLEPRETRVAEDSVDILVNVYEMNQFKIGHVNVKGNTKTQEKVLRREFYTRPAEYFSRAAIVRTIRQLSQLNYFNPEKIKPDYVLVDDKTVDLTYEVEEKSSDNINASVGYSGAFGVTGALGFTINNFSITEPLTGGAGQVLNFEWMFGEGSRYRTFTIGFTEPWLFDTSTLLGVTLFDTRQIYTFDYQRTGGSVRLGRRFKWPDDYFRGDWIVDAQVNEVRDGRGIYREGQSSQFSITQVFSRNSVDNPIFPTMGSSVSLSIQMSGGPLLPGSIDFHKWAFNSEWYLPLFGSSRMALYLSTQYGYISTFYKDSYIQPVDLFFMGGTGLGYISTTPLRGYEDQSIGPRNANGDIVGGRAMARQTVELRFALAVNPIPIYLLGFVEGGNVYESFARADFFDLKRSAGLGARLLINPIGMIGFDYGYGFDDVFPIDGKPDGWRFHFVFGKGF
jgi:outer membrane protein insertion porin family